MQSISVLIKPASGMCNMSCDYCFYADEQKNRKTADYGYMSFDTLKNVIRKTILNAENSIAFAFQGGEPTLRGIDFFKEVIRLEKKYNRNGIIIENSIQTNGYAIDGQWCEFFRDNDFLVGLSVDGIKECHDRYRHTKNGGSTFDAVCRAANLMDRYQVPYNILTVVNRSVAANADKIYHFYKKKGWMYQQYIPCLEPLYSRPGQMDYSVTPEQYGSFLTTLFELWYEDFKHGREPYIRQFDNYIGILWGFTPEACDQRGICGIQHVVEADGSVYPCDFYTMDEYCIGNFNENSFDEIQEKRKEIQFVETSVRNLDKCRECEFYRLCRGGCRRNWVFDSESRGEYNYFCESYKMFLPKIMSLGTELS